MNFAIKCPRLSAHDTSTTNQVGCTGETTHGRVATCWMLVPQFSSFDLNVVCGHVFPRETELKYDRRMPPTPRRSLPYLMIKHLWFLCLGFCVLNVLDLYESACVVLDLFSSVMCLAVQAVTTVPSVWDLYIRHLTVVGPPARMCKGRGRLSLLVPKPQVTHEHEHQD
ncbi:hypothetical protein HJG60_008313 [Phyllostomus discolor]|uniref:Uncharacterized protein n=1 Tax=Phyllostomus discolor TaxID=89673 RepID=A0A834DQJ8_9CHIR|nr:hypothetical protein HJG60_008313 [Phyllostomus discolor]